MATLIVKATKATSATLVSSSATYATARTGGTISVGVAGETYLVGGQSNGGFPTATWTPALSSGGFKCFEAFYEFAIPALPVGSTVTNATITAYGSGTGSPGLLGVYSKDWGTSVTTTDWVSGAALGSPLAFLSGLDFTDAATAAFPLANINYGGSTRVVMTTTAVAAATTPTASVWWYIGGSTDNVYMPTLTVTYDGPPAAPALSVPQNFLAGASTTLASTWTFVDSGDSQTAYQMLVKKGGVLYLDTGKVASTSSSLTQSGSLFREGDTYTFSVRVWDTADLVSPYSAESTSAALTRAPRVYTEHIRVLDPAVAATARWSYDSEDTADPQSAYRVLVKLGTTTVYDSGTIASAAATHVIPENTFTLSNTYSMTVAVTDTLGARTTTSHAVGLSTLYSPPAVTLTAPGTPPPAAAKTFLWAPNIPATQGGTIFMDDFPVTGVLRGWGAFGVSSTLSVSGGELRYYVTSGTVGAAVSIAKTMTGLVVGRVYKVEAETAGFSAAGSGTIGVTGAGTSPSVAFDVYSDATVSPIASYTFTATATSHQTVVTGTIPGEYADIVVNRVTMTDVTPDSQTAYRYVLQSQNGLTTITDTGKVLSTTSSYTLPANTLAVGTGYRWSAYTWNKFDLISPLADWGTFATPSDIEVTITAPTPDGLVLETSGVTVNWIITASGTETQTQRRIQVIKVSDSSVLVDTGMVASTSMTYAVTGMQSGFLYRIEVNVTSSIGSVSPVASTTVFSDWGNPNKPSAVVFAAATGAITIVVSNPTPTGNRPVVISNLVYRAGEDGVFTFIGATSNNGTFNDYLVAASTQYSYYVRADS